MLKLPYPASCIPLVTMASAIDLISISVQTSCMSPVRLGCPQEPPEHGVYWRPGVIGFNEISHENKVSEQL